ncbi:MAG TPA: hypothetical protein VJX74_03780 [Blastocatellia bacterium]|nr:hypothetical protein [Blastocatellia bacterium]
MQTSTGEINPDLLNALGISRPANIRNFSAKLAASFENRGKLNKKSQPQPNVGQPLTLNARSALSAALITSIGGRDNQFSEVALIADWDGREDCTADRGAKVDDFSNVEPEIDFTLTRTAISEHTVAKGAIVTVRGMVPKKIRFKDRQGDSNLFNKIVLKGGICRALPGAIIVRNPGGPPSVPLQCNRSCPTQN